MTDPDLRLPWCVGTNWDVRDASENLVARAWSRELAEAIVAAMNGTRQGVLKRNAVTERPYQIWSGDRFVAGGETPNEAWDNAAGFDGPVRMVVR
jgi:hypothetical protein